MKSIGQDTIVVTDHKAKKTEVSFSKKLHYYFNNAISKTKYFVLFLLLVSFLLGLIMTLIQLCLKSDSNASFFDSWWQSITQILGLGKGNDWADRLITFLFWVCSIAISGTVIGFIATSIKGLVDKLRKGKSQIISKNHILILGWSDSIFPVLKELSLANENVSSTKVVIFSKLDNEKMQDAITAKINKKLNLKIITRSGDISNPIELALVNPNEAKNIVILGESDTSDSDVLTTILALTTIITNSSISIIAQLKNSLYLNNLKSVRNINIIPIVSKNIITNVTVQTLREKGIGVVILDLLDFDGDEIYFSDIPELQNKTYKEALLSFDKSSVIGIVDKEGATLLNPDMNAIIQPGDKLILISEDDSTIFYKSQPIEGQTNFKVSITKPELEEKNILFIGWSSMGIDILDSFCSFISSYSKITVLYFPDYVHEDDLLQTNYNGIEVNFSEMNHSKFDLENFIENGKYEEVMILGYTEEISTRDADVLSLMEMLRLDSILQKKQTKPFRVVAQLFDSSKAKLASATETEELIVGDNLCSIIIAQLTENPKLNKVFLDLFDAEGAAINMRPIENYAELNKEINYLDIVRRGSAYNESVIGIRIDNKNVNTHTEGVYLNPSKSMLLNPKNGDQVIVIS
jgi:hypothetical protein